MAKLGNICRVYMKVMDPKRVHKLLGSTGDVEITRSTISYFAYFSDAKVDSMRRDERVHKVEVLRRNVDYSTFQRYCKLYRKFVGGTKRTMVESALFEGF